MFSERDEGNMCKVSHAESVFPLCGSGKHFPRVKVFFYVDRESDGNHFPLTTFPKCCQTLESEETEFLEFSFLETNGA